VDLSLFAVALPIPANFSACSGLVLVVGSGEIVTPTRHESIPGGSKA